MPLKKSFNFAIKSPTKVKASDDDASDSESSLSRGSESDISDDAAFVFPSDIEFVSSDSEEHSANEFVQTVYSDSDEDSLSTTNQSDSSNNDLFENAPSRRIR